MYTHFCNFILPLGSCNLMEPFFGSLNLHPAILPKNWSTNLYPMEFREIVYGILVSGLGISVCVPLQSQVGTTTRLGL